MFTDLKSSVFVEPPAWAQLLSESQRTIYGLAWCNSWIWIWHRTDSMAGNL